MFFYKKLLQFTNAEKKIMPTIPQYDFLTYFFFGLNTLNIFFNTTKPTNPLHTQKKNCFCPSIRRGRYYTQFF